MDQLDLEEQELLATFEAGEWQSIQEPNRLLELQSYARSAIAKDKHIKALDYSSSFSNPSTSKTENSVNSESVKKS